MGTLSVYEHVIYTDENANEPVTPRFEYPKVTLSWNSPEDREGAIQDAKTVIAAARIRNDADNARSGGSPYTIQHYIVEQTIIEVV